MGRPAVPESQHTGSFPTLAWMVTSAYRPTEGTALPYLSINSFFTMSKSTSKLVQLDDPLHHVKYPFG